MIGWGPMLAEDVKKIIFPSGIQDFDTHSEEKKVLTYDEMYPDDNLEANIDDSIVIRKKKTRREYKFKKNEVTLYNWGRRYNIK